jgi:hypothetical protein
VECITINEGLRNACEATFFFSPPGWVLQHVIESGQLAIKRRGRSFSLRMRLFRIFSLGKHAEERTIWKAQICFALLTRKMQLLADETSQSRNIHSVPVANSDSWPWDMGSSSRGECHRWL